MKQILFIALTLLTFRLHASDYYWVGGGGNWSDVNHWRLDSSSGPVPAIVPSATDNVFFNANSGFGTTVASRTVTLASNGSCNNMTWSNVPNSPIFSGPNTFAVEVWGNAILAPTVTYTCMLKFKGAAAATITTGGTVQGAFGIEIDKPGSSLSVTDSLIVPYYGDVATSYIRLTSGTFDIAGKKVSHYRFVSNSGNARTLEMTNADVNITFNFVYSGANKILNAAGSVLNGGIWLTIDGGSYHHLINNGGSANVSIYNTTIRTLVFPSAAQNAGINSGNTIDSLQCLGALGIGHNNTIGYLQAGGNFTVYGTGNTVDSLLLASNRVANFQGTFNINKYLYVEGTPCEAITEINGDTVSGTVNFASGAIVDISNVLLTGVHATGPVTPIAVNGIDGGGNTGFTITEPSIAGTTLYWVNGPGDWNDRSHWSTASGGTGGACVPFKNDNVVFNANSGLASGTVTTSSSSFCHNMSWSGVGNVTFSESATSPFRIYGSLVMDNSVTMNASLEFTGTEPVSITINNTTAGTLQFIIAKSGSGVVTLTDNWNNPAGSFIQRSGGLNLSGRTVNLDYYSSNVNATRSLDISNATLTFNQYWDYRGSGKTLNAANSYITSNGGFAVNGSLSYDRVDITSTTAAGATLGYFITGTTFGQLTFTNTSAASEVALDGGNNIRRLEFKGKGTFNAGGNNIDSLILAGSRNYTFAGTTTINDYIKAESPACSGLLEMRGPGTLAFASGADIHLNNVYMQDMTATGPMTSIAFNGADAGGNNGWTITTLAGGARYWVNGSGDWNDPAHWSATSGGTGGTACVPTVYDDVYFDAGSGFTNASRTVTINDGNAFCHNISWAGAANNPIFNKTAGLRWEVWGDSIILNPATVINTLNSFATTQYLTVKGSNTTFMTGDAPAGNFDIAVEKTGSGVLTLLNNYTNTNTTYLVATGGFNASGRTLNVFSVDNGDLANATSIDISNASITTNLWRYSGTPTNHVLNAANSSITTVSFQNDGKQYNRVSVSGTAESDAVIRTTTIDSLIFTNLSAASVVDIENNNTINYLEFKGSGRVTGTGNTINTLVFFPGKIYTFTAGTTTNITNEWFASGTPCNLTEIVSSSTTANATINKANGSPEFDYIRVRRITAGGSTPFVAFNHTIDQGNNINWNIAPYSGATPIYGLGPDTALPASAFPYTLHTDGFFGNPSSLYLWNNGSTADSLIVNDTGKYYVNVGFVDNCNISDTIRITLQIPLPVTLSKFSVTTQHCQGQLNWSIANATNFSHFIVEKSKDGRSFSSIADVACSAGIREYAYTDRALEKGKTYYRLKMMDHDGNYQYSAVEAIQSDCESRLVKVYPTQTKGVVYIDLPSGYEQAQIEVYNAFGQLLSLPKTGTVTRIGMHSVQLHGLAQGHYLLKVTNGGEVNTFKIIYQP